MAFNKALSVAGILATALSVAACQSDGSESTLPRGQGNSPYYAEPIAPAVLPATNKIGRSTSSSKTRSWVDANGTKHTKTKGSSVNVSVDPNATAGFIAAVLGASLGASQSGRPTASNPANYSGDWHLSAGEEKCKLTLSDLQGGTGRASITGGCFNSDLFRVTRWSLRGYEIVLEGFGEPSAKMRVTQPNRMDGTLTNGGTVTAWR